MMHRVGGVFSPCVVVLLLLAVFGIASAAAGVIQVDDRNESRSHGVFVVEVAHKGGAWKQAGVLAFGEWPASRELDLAPWLYQGDTATVRIRHQGEGAAHLDRVLLGGAPPVSVQGALDADPVRLAAREDNDLLHVTGRSLVCAFPANREPLLSLTARAESSVLFGEPFRFPRPNLTLPPDQFGHFVRYRRAGSGDVAQTLLQEETRTASGHPASTFQVTAREWDDVLRLYLDFGSDNTMDDDKDWAAVHVKTEHGVQTFRASARQRHWGGPSFRPSDVADYRHKVYDFAIPFDELPDPGAAAIDLAFSAYGTATSFGSSAPDLACSETSGNCLMVYRYAYIVQDPLGPIDTFEIRGQMLNAAGNPVGDWFNIDASPNPATERRAPRLAWDSTNNRYLVVWHDLLNGGIHTYGRIVNADGSFHTNTFVVSDAHGSMSGVDVDWSPDSQKFLVTWADPRDGDDEIFYRMVTAAGVVEGTQDLTLSANGMDDTYPRVAYDPVEDNFVVVWTFDSGAGATGQDIWSHRVTAAGAVTGSATAVSLEASDQSFPAVAVNGNTGRVLVVYTDYQYGPDGDILGRWSDGTGAMHGQSFLVDVDIAEQWGVDVQYSAARDQWLATWVDDRDDPTSYNVYARLIAGDMTPLPEIFPLMQREGILWGQVAGSLESPGRFVFAVENVPAGNTVGDGHVIYTDTKPHLALTSVPLLLQ